MDELETACMKVLKIAEQRPPEEATYAQLTQFASEKAYDVKRAVMDMGKILRARLAQKDSLERAATSSNANATVLFSPVASKK